MGNGGRRPQDGRIGDGRGKALPPAAKLKQCDEQVILAVSPLASSRLLALLPLGLGALAFYMGGAFLCAPVENPVNDPVLARTLGAMLCLGIGFLSMRAGYFGSAPAKLCIRTAERTYREDRGWWPFREETEGSLDEIDRLSCRIYAESGNATTLLLHWRDQSRPPFALHTSDREGAIHSRRTVARLLDLPPAEEA